MKKEIFLIISTLLITSNVISQQNLDKLMTRNLIDCEDVAYNSSQLFIDFIKSEKYDSAKIILDYWKDKCNLREPIQRAEIILGILTNSFNEDLYDSTIFDYVYLFEVRLSYSGSDNSEYYETKKPYFGYIKWDSEFDNYTKEISQFLLSRYSENSLEKSFAYLYSGNIDAFFEGVQHKENSNSKISQYYHSQVNEYLDLPDSHLSGFIGVRFPDNKMKSLGVHPEFGYHVGLKKNRFTGDFTLAFSVAGTPQEYTVYKEKDTIQSNYYFGGNIGIDFQYDIFRYNKNEIYLLTGFGWDGFDTEFDWNESDIKSASSYNLNVGLGYRYYFKQRRYIGLYYKYNIVDYTLNNVTDFTGNIHLIRFVFGGLNNEKKYQKLDDLKYQY